MKHLASPRSLAAALTAAFVLPAAASAAVLVLSPEADGFIRASQSAAQTNNAGNVIFLVGDVSETDVLRGVLSFNLNDPALIGATINSVTLTLNLNGPDTGTSFNAVETIELLRLTESFTEAGATWTSRNGATNWTTAGGTFATPALATTTANPSTSVKGADVVFSSAEFATSVAGSVGQNIDLLLKLATVDANRSVFRFVSQESATPDAALRPVLTIDYTPAAIPEPSAFAAVAGLGALGLVAARRRRRR